VEWTVINRSHSAVVSRVSNGGRSRGLVTCDRCHRRFSSYAALKQHYASKHSNVRWPEEFEKQLTAEREAASYRFTLRPNRPSHAGLIIAILLIAIVAGGAAYFVSNSGSGSSYTGGDPTLQICLSGTIVEHIHPHLTIMIQQSPLTIPANIGITGDCTRPVHTHDPSGEIHVESPFNYPYTLGDFFLVWGQPFDSTRILQYTTDATHTISMTVNGKPSTEYRNYVIHDGDQIVITYGASG
jgi:hypothetical protein